MVLYSTYDFIMYCQAKKKDDAGDEKKEELQDDRTPKGHKKGILILKICLNAHVTV